MIGDIIESVIQIKVKEVLSESKDVDIPDDIIETDNIGEVIEKLAILHCRMWYLEDAISSAQSAIEVAELKKKIDICFKVKRPRYVEAINKMIDNSILTGRSLQEDSVKLYKGFDTSIEKRVIPEVSKEDREKLYEGVEIKKQSELKSTYHRTNLEGQEWIKKNKIHNWGPKI